MSLVTEWGRYDRAGITERAKELYAAGDRTWDAARAEAYAEARRVLNPVPTIAIAQEASRG